MPGFGQHLLKNNIKIFDVAIAFCLSLKISVTPHFCVNCISYFQPMVFRLKKQSRLDGKLALTKQLLVNVLQITILMQLQV